MIYRRGKLILEIEQNVRGIGEQAGQLGEKSIGAIYKGSKLVWLTVYNAIKSCYSSGIWLSDKLWTPDDTWKNN